MDWKELAKEVAKIGLPLLGAVLPVPGGADIGTALASAIGAKSGSPGDILATLTASADAVQKAKEFEATHQERLLQIRLDAQTTALEIAAKDRDSARAREIAIKDRTPAQLAWTIIGGFLGISGLQLVALMFFPEQATKIPPQGWLLIGNVSGYLANEAKQAAAYYFGSSVGSRDKDTTLAEIAKAP